MLARKPWRLMADAQKLRDLNPRLLSKEPYSQLDRGVIGPPTKPCSVKFLVGLAEDLFYISEHLSMWTHPQTPRAVIRRVLPTVLSELQRLKDNRSLFAFDTDYVEFFDIVNLILEGSPNLQEVKAMECKKFKPAAHSVIAINRSRELYERQGAYDFRRGSWDQFFQHLAPGVNYLHPQMVQTPPTHFATKHVIPPGGLEVIREWEANIEEVRKRMEPDAPYPGHHVAFPSSVRNFSVLRNGGRLQRHTSLGTLPDARGMSTNDSGTPTASKMHDPDEMGFEFGHLKVKPRTHPHVPGSVMITQFTRILPDPEEVDDDEDEEM